MVLLKDNTSRPLIVKSIQEAISEVISEKFNIDTLRPPEVSATRVEGITKDDKKIYYTQDEIDSLGKFEEFEGVTIVLPNPDSYIKLLNLTSEEYSVEKGNPLSDFFISSVITQGTTIVGYLIGQYVNQMEDIKLYTVKSNEIEKFLDENPILKETGFINARLGSRLNKRNNETAYFLKSCLNNLSFRDIPNLISKIEDTEKFF